MPKACVVALMLLAGAPVPASAEPARVETHRVEQTPSVETLRLTGSVNAPRTSQLSSAIAGQVRDVHVAIGDRVDQGSRLLILDTREAELERQRAQANVAQAQAERDNAQRLLSEANQLTTQQSIAATEQRQRQSALAAAEATLEAQQAERALWELRVSLHDVTAPFDALITQRESEVGEWVTPGDTMMTLIDIDSLTLDFSVPFSAYARMDDATLDVRLEGDPQWHAATPRARIPQDTASRQFLLRAEPTDTQNLLPGMAVEGRLLLTGSPAPGVPRDALIRRPDGSVSVWLAREEDGEWRAVEQRVTPGSSHEGMVFIEDGIAAGERVIVVGNERLEAGQPLSLIDD